jgi:cholesterol 24-hydroxylase
LRKNIKYVRDTGRKIINERLKAMKDGDYTPNDILSSILINWKDSEEFDLEAMVDDFVTFFIAGQETTANTLAFCFIVLGKRKDIFLKAREEIDAVIGERTEITYQDAMNLKYCAAIFKESLRLYPPVGGLNRINTEEMDINGMKIPKGSSILLSSYVTGRSEEYFPNSTEFNPERFIKDSPLNNIENYTYFPFSLGPRNCIGQNFAQIEGIIMIAKLIQRFDYSLDPDHEFVVLEEFTLKPKGGTRVCLSLRR